MDPITSRNRSSTEEPEVYWRRRLFALAAGLAVLGLLAWAVGGASSTRLAATTASVSSQAPRLSLPPAVGSPSLFASSSSPSPSPSPSSILSASTSSGAAVVGKAPAKPAAARVRRKALPLMAHAGGSGCPAADVVISMTMNGDSYDAGVRPEFSISVVSTDARACAVNLGARYLTVVVSSGGVRAWGSADCAAGAGSSAALLSRGVPAQRHFSWDRLLSAPGCKSLRSEAGSGTYTAVASDGGRHSQTLVFVLR